MTKDCQAEWAWMPVRKQCKEIDICVLILT